MTGCPVCRHRSREAIDGALRDRWLPPARVAARHGLDARALRDHGDHLEPVAAVERPEPSPGHGQAFLEAWRRRATAEGRYLPTWAPPWALSWRHRAGWPSA